ncbi:hypothetical protein SPYCA_0156 [Sphingopyxis sp. FD7]|nr:hypothetical protein SPYCA_0156 [Sphingopyxis sp. FD7]
MLEPQQFLFPIIAIAVGAHMRGPEQAHRIIMMQRSDADPRGFGQLLDVRTCCLLITRHPIGDDAA